MEKQIIIKELCPSSIQSLLQDGALFVDIRESEEVERVSYGLPNIIYIPMSKLEERYKEIPNNQEVIIACSSGTRSIRVATFLAYRGYENITSMKEGLIRWVLKGYPTIGETSDILRMNANTSCSSGCH
jgi:rhodanese-related sulfurtransferase